MGESPLGDGLAWLATKRVTLGLCGLLVAVFAVEAAVRATYGASTWIYLFFATREPTPGWVLAPFAHVGIEHLVSSITVVLAYGSLAESLLPAHVYYAFYVVAGYAAVLAQVALYHATGTLAGTLGASGGALALVTFVTVAASLDKFPDEGPSAALTPGLAFLGLLVVVVVVATDFVPGVVLMADTAGVGHLAGAFVGAAYALWVPPAGFAPSGAKGR